MTPVPHRLWMLWEDCAKPITLRHHGSCSNCLRLMIWEGVSSASLCVCVCMCVCMHVRTCVCMITCMNVCVCVHTCVNVCVWVYVCEHVSAHVFGVGGLGWICMPIPPMTVALTFTPHSLVRQLRDWASSPLGWTQTQADLCSCNNTEQNNGTFLEHFSSEAQSVLQ